jgi:hypothetical protein
VLLLLLYHKKEEKMCKLIDGETENVKKGKEVYEEGTKCM